MVRQTVRTVVRRKANRALLALVPCLQFFMWDMHETTRGAEPQGAGVVLNHPVKGVARQAVLARHCRNATTSNGAQPALCCCPQRAALIEQERADLAITETLCRPIGLLDLAVFHI